MITDFYSRLKKLFTDSSLQSKLVWIYFLLIILPLGFFTFYAVHQLSALVKKQTLASVHKAFDNTADAVEGELGRLGSVLDILTMDQIVYQVSSQEHSDYSYTRRLADSTQLATTFEHLRLLSGVSSIRMYVKNDYLYSNQQHDIIPVSEVEGSGWYRSLDGSLSSFWFYPGDFSDQPEKERNWFTAMRVIYNPSNIHEPLAILRADTRASRLEQLIRQPGSTENGFYLLLRENEVLLSSSDTYSAELVSSCISQYTGDIPGQWESLTLEGQGCYALCSPLPQPGWRMAVLLPYGEVYRPSHTLRLEMLLVVCIVGLLSYGIALAISRSTLSRLSRLNQTMQAVEQGDVAIRITPEGKDEIGQLMGSFSRMMERIDSLMDEKVAYGREIKNLELKALQAQINPHFLYNSLDLISCTAIVHNVPEITRMVSALARFYKLSLSRGREVISIEDELQHARLYIQIQNMRFENRIHVEWDIEEKVKDCQIIKIVLQPLIENAIIHGIFEKPERSGTLSVSAGCREDGIRIIVRDDGVGMDATALHANFDPTPPGDITQTKGGYGIRNINDRLHLAYGAPYGLFCESIPGSHTTVTIFIPVIRPCPAKNRS